MLARPGYLGINKARNLPCNSDLPGAKMNSQQWSEIFLISPRQIRKRDTHETMIRTSVLRNPGHLGFRLRTPAFLTPRCWITSTEAIVPQWVSSFGSAMSIPQDQKSRRQEHKIPENGKSNRGHIQRRCASRHSHPILSASPNVAALVEVKVVVRCSDILWRREARAGLRSWSAAGLTRVGLNRGIFARLAIFRTKPRKQEVVVFFYRCPSRWSASFQVTLAANSLCCIFLQRLTRTEITQKRQGRLPETWAYGKPQMLLF